MATNDFVRFRSEYLPRHPDLQKKLDTLTDRRERVKVMVAAGREAGFEFSAAEAEVDLRNTEQRILEAEAELTDVQATSIAGGFLALQEATQMESRKFHASESRSIASTRPADRQLLYRDRVVVGPDGNGVTADRFATTVVGDDVRYVLIVAEDVCRDRGVPAPCPPPVEEITITLNETVVLQTPFEFERDRIEIALNATAESLNQIVISARGQPGAVARVAVVSERPTDVLFGGLSVLPWASTTHRVRTFLAIHNAGATETGFRITFFNTDGSVAGRSAPQRLGRHATESVNLHELAAALNLRWTSGAVHVEWVGRGSSRVSTVATEEHSELNGVHAILSAIRTLPLDDYRPRPVTVAAAEEFGF